MVSSLTRRTTMHTRSMILALSTQMARKYQTARFLTGAKCGLRPQSVCSLLLHLLHGKRRRADEKRFCRELGQELLEKSYVSSECRAGLDLAVGLYGFVRRPENGVDVFHDHQVERSRAVWLLQLSTASENIEQVLFALSHVCKLKYLRTIHGHDVVKFKRVHHALYIVISTPGMPVTIISWRQRRFVHPSSTPLEQFGRSLLSKYGGVEVLVLHSITPSASSVVRTPEATNIYRRGNGSRPGYGENSTTTPNIHYTYTTTKKNILHYYYYILFYYYYILYIYYLLLIINYYIYCYYYY